MKKIKNSAAPDREYAIEHPDLTTFKKVAKDHINHIKGIKKMKTKPNGLYLARIDLGTQPPTHAKLQLAIASKALKKAFKEHGKIIVSGYEGPQKGFVQIEVIQVNTH